MIRLHLLLHISFKCQFYSHIYFYNRFIELRGDIEKNQGPKFKPDQSFSVCHRNLDSIAAHNCSKIQSLIAYNCIHYFDIVYLSLTCLNSAISSDNENWDIPAHGLVRSDHPFNNKRGGVCVYFESSLPIQILSISMLHESTNLEIKIDGKLCNLTCLYRSSSQKEWKNLRRLLKILSWIYGHI